MAKRTPASFEAERKLLGIVAAKGGKLLSDYKSSKEKVNIMCANGHIIFIAPNHVNEGSWCKQCPSKITKELMDGFQYVVQQKNGEIIVSCAKAKELATIQCEYGHQWNATPSAIYKTDVWCPHCDQQCGVTTEMKVRNTIQYRDGLLIGEYGKKLNIQCEQEHEFQITPYNLLAGNWCKFCSSSSGTKEKLETTVTDKGGKLLTPYINSRTGVTIQCSLGHTWTTCSGHIINDNSWCPTCPKSSTIKAEENFVTEVAKRGGRLVTEYTGIHSKVTIICSANHEFTVEPNSIMSMGTWCSKCSGNCSKQAGENFTLHVNKLKGKLHTEYTHAYGEVTVECEFGHKWNTIPHNVMSSGTWCSVCRESHGERTVRLILKKHNITFTPQKIHPSLDGKYYDFYFVHDNKEFYLEYDGGQHFSKVDFFCRTEEEYQYRRSVDVLKSRTVVNNGGYLIRLDHTLSEENLEAHILKAISGTEKLYLSNPNMYQWIIDGINQRLMTLNVTIPTQSTTSNVRIPAQPITLSTSNVRIPSQSILPLVPNVTIPSQPILPSVSNVTIPSQPILPSVSNVRIPAQPVTLSTSNGLVPTQSITLPTNYMSLNIIKDK